MLQPVYAHLRLIPELCHPLTLLRGIGTRRADILAQKDLHTIADLLTFFPNRYEDRRRMSPILSTNDGEKAWITGRVRGGGEQKLYRSRRRLFRIIIEDETAGMELIWFHFKKPYLTPFAQEGTTLTAYGKVQRRQGIRQMVHPEIARTNPANPTNRFGFYPVYPAVPGVSDQVVRSAVKEALERFGDQLVDALPEEIAGRLQLPSLSDAIRWVHTPPEGSDTGMLNQHQTPHHRRLTFDRFFHFMLNVLKRKQVRGQRRGPGFPVPEDLLAQVGESLPFQLTDDQERALREILDDMAGAGPMNRLLQGDVGCGKTVVAAAASCAAVKGHWQAAVMVPTVVLARQHYETFSSLSSTMGFHPVLLTGALDRRERQAAYDKVREGRCNVVIGTQALIQKEVSFSRLGLVIIDEQHRFGVRQRALLDRKGVNPHLLVMTATPIPRTLAMTVYADMDLSAIRQSPEGRLPVVTHMIDEDRKREVFESVAGAMKRQEQVMVICPVIEGSEEHDLKNALEMHARLKKLFAPPFRVGLVHGRLPSEEKEKVMGEFRKGEVDLLVGTTVVEVGVHAPGATTMVVEHPERFGLIQLHQLRGRVGRGSKQGTCMLMTPKGLSDASRERLRVLTETQDGFEIARKDLEMRGQGELMGIRQAGAGELGFREVFLHPELLETAKREAEELIAKDPQLELPENRMLKEMLTPSSKRALDF
jgi:ATP-dependent DNA helicase RecG